VNGFCQAKWCLLATLTMALTGCSKSGVNRLPLRGTVGFSNGATVSGTITFIPATGATGPAATATLTDGNYQFDRDTGPTAGPHQVIVRRIMSKTAALAARTKGKAPVPPPADAAQRMEWSLPVNLSERDTNACNLVLDR